MLNLPRLRILLVALVSFLVMAGCANRKIIRNREIFHYQETIVIDRDIQTVWEYMDDLDKNFEYQSFLKQVEKSPEGPLKVGSVLTYEFGFLWTSFTNRYVITAYDPPYRMAFKSLPDSEIEATGENTFERLAENRTRLTMVFDPKPSGYFENKTDEEIDEIYADTLTEVLGKIKKHIEE